jgi:hypothetical protein
MDMQNQITGPTYWASYFINGDASGLTAEERKQADAWLKREGVAFVLDCDNEPRFTWHMRLHAPELNCDGGDVMEYTVQID